MARILIPCWPVPTHVHPALAIALELRKTGCEVRFFTGAASIPVLESEGFVCYPFQALDAQRFRGLVADLLFSGSSGTTVKLWREFLVETIPNQLADLEAVRQDWPPDRILSDMAMWSPILILQETWRIPVAIFSHLANSIFPGPQGPVSGFPLPRPLRRLDRLRAPVLRLLASAATSGLRRAANAMRQRYALAPLTETVTEYSGRAPLYLIPGCPRLDFDRADLPASVQYVGSCIWEPSRLPGEAPGAGPLVVGDEGGLYPRDPDRLRLAATAASRAGLRVLLLPGYGRAEMPWPGLPSGAKVCYGASLRRSLDAASVLVTNGNCDSVLSAMEAGVPVVVTPETQDQNELAFALEHAGAGVRVPRPQQNSEAIERAIRRVLTGHYAANAAKVGESLRARGGAPKAARLLTTKIPGTEVTVPRGQVT